MKSKILMLTAFIGVTGASLANASDGTVNFVGQLVPQTCAITVDGQPNGTVRMPNVSTGLLATVGRTTGRTGFTIELRNCVGTAGSAAAIFSSGTSVDPNTGNLRVAQGEGAAAGVQLQLLDDVTDKPIKAGHFNQRATTSRSTIVDGSVDMRYAVQYIATGTSSAGLVSSSVTYSIDYQ
ncbi:type 1 fimbrial protein [Pseudomonas fluorescens]|nr:type 1 fimbrial protein [Pseudomonas fluorescens]